MPGGKAPDIRAAKITHARRPAGLACVHGSACHSRHAGLPLRHAPVRLPGRVRAAGRLGAARPSVRFQPAGAELGG